MSAAASLSKSNLVLFAAALLLAVPTGLTVWDEREVFTEVTDLARLFPGFTQANVRAIGIAVPLRDEKGGLTRDEKGELRREITQFVRTDVDWVIADGPLGGAPVRDEVVYERVLRHLEAIPLDEDALVLADGTPEQLLRYGLSAEEAVEIRCVDGAQRLIAELLVGKDASAGRVGKDVVRGFFVRARDSADVVLYEQDYWVIDPDPRQWIDRHPVRLPIDEVVRVHVKAPKGEVAFERATRDTPDWTKAIGPDGVGPPRNNEVRALIQQLLAFEIQDYVTRLPADGSLDQILAERGLATPKIFAEARLADGRVFRIDVGSKVPGKNEYWVRCSAVEFLLSAGDWVATRFDRDPEPYFDPPRR
ncbi:MAG: DUF4340 domain-containing protein [Planctomycetes bacterium]|nr:DUF4340 domain-containing protein [Planctomycetota bacterium]